MLLYTPGPRKNACSRKKDYSREGAIPITVHLLLLCYCKKRLPRTPPHPFPNRSLLGPMGYTYEALRALSSVLGRAWLHSCPGRRAGKNLCPFARPRDGSGRNSGSILQESCPLGATDDFHVFIFHDCSPCIHFKIHSLSIFKLFLKSNSYARFEGDVFPNKSFGLKKEWILTM